jgi:hypothetical protein
MCASPALCVLVVALMLASPTPGSSEEDPVFFPSCVTSPVFRNATVHRLGPGPPQVVAEQPPGSLIAYARCETYGATRIMVQTQLTNGTWTSPVDMEAGYDDSGSACCGAFDVTYNLFKDYGVGCPTGPVRYLASCAEEACKLTLDWPNDPLERDEVCNPDCALEDFLPGKTNNQVTAVDGKQIIQRVIMAPGETLRVANLAQGTLVLNMAANASLWVDLYLEDPAIGKKWFLTNVTDTNCLDPWKFTLRYDPEPTRDICDVGPLSLLAFCQDTSKGAGSEQCVLWIAVLDGIDYTKARLAAGLPIVSRTHCKTVLSTAESKKSGGTRMSSSPPTLVAVASMVATAVMAVIF